MSRGETVVQEIPAYWYDKVKYYLPFFFNVHMGITMGWWYDEQEYANWHCLCKTLERQNNVICLEMFTQSKRQCGILPVTVLVVILNLGCTLELPGELFIYPDA